MFLYSRRALLVSIAIVVPALQACSGALLEGDFADVESASELAPENGGCCSRPNTMDEGADERRRRPNPPRPAEPARPSDDGNGTIEPTTPPSRPTDPASPEPVNPAPAPSAPVGVDGIPMTEDSELTTITGPTGREIVVRSSHV